MSTSALIAAKKRLETCLKKYEIPTESTRPTTEPDSCKSGVLLFSLLQSRLNWTSSVFTKYKTDPVQQPKRTNNSRKKWPNMKYLGTGTMELGPHIFENTAFYEATRSIPWKTIAKQQGLNVPEDEDTIMTEANEDETKADDDIDHLKFVDIVFELSEIPNERFIFPKDALISLSVEDGPIELHASFVLPIDPTDGFFEKPKDQILKFGKSCQLPYIKDFIKSTAESKKKDTTVYQPVNIRITQINQTTIDALEDNVNTPDQVKKSMSIKMKSFPKKTFVKYDLSQDPINNTEIQDLLKRSFTVPDIATGPIMAEKRRNEILNQIKLGKRLRDEKFEAELPRNKYSNSTAKEDGLLKCAYCSTKYTAMWRPGPGGHGTLCNSCGIQWKRGEILKGAAVISIEEEKQLLKEKREREKIAEALELEKLDRENKKIQKKVERQQSVVQDVVDVTNKKFAAQLISQRNRTKAATNIPSKSSASSTPEPAPAVVTDTTPTITEKKKSTTSKSSKVKAESSKAAQATEQTGSTTQNHTSETVTVANPPPQQQQPVQQPAESSSQGQQTQQAQAQPQQAQAQTQAQTQQNNSFFLYSHEGIPLPTLSIDFGGLSKFSHPNCAVTLLDGHFHIRLCTEAGEQSLINLEKSDLANAQFAISQEGDAIALREVLTMTISPLAKPINIIHQSIPEDSKLPITIRFLEKLDPTGGAVVKRILQRWLVTIPQPS